jgi:ribosomal protein L11 methylase PrmA
MPWFQLLIDCSAGDAERISDLLSDAGAEAVTMLDAEDQPLYEPPLGTTPLWDRTRVSGLFTAETDMDAVLAEVARGLAPAAADAPGTSGRSGLEPRLDGPLPAHALRRSPVDRAQLA